MHKHAPRLFGAVLLTALSLSACKRSKGTVSGEGDGQDATPVPSGVPDSGGQPGDNGGNGGNGGNGPLPVPPTIPTPIPTPSASPTPDTTAPIPGADGDVTFESVTAAGFLLNWRLATDPGIESPLEYRVCAALTEDALGTAQAMEGPDCIVLKDYTGDMSTLTVTSLKSKTRYFVRVVVKDAYGNRALYDQTSIVTGRIVHVAYWNDTREDIGYATNATGAFVAETIPGACPSDTTTPCGRHVSMRLDAEGRPHVAYTSKVSGHWTLNYTEQTVLGWTPPVMIDPDAVVEWNDLAIDAAGRTHIVYFQKQVSGVSTNDLRYVLKDGVTWSNTLAYGSGASGSWNGMALDAMGVPHVSFLKDGSNIDLYVADLTAGLSPVGDWAKRVVVDKTDAVGAYSAIALDDAGNKYVSYYDQTNGDLKFASNASGAFATRRVDGANDTGRHTKIAVMTEGSRTTVHIVYYDATDLDLKHATCVSEIPVSPLCTDPSAIWRTQTIQAAGDVGEWPSLEIDGDGILHVSYFDASKTKSMYVRATRDTAGIWVFAAPDLVDNVGTVGKFSQVRVEP